MSLQSSPSHRQVPVKVKLKDRPELQDENLKEFFNRQGRLVVPCRYLAKHLQEEIASRDMGEVLKNDTVRYSDRYIHTGRVYSAEQAVASDIGMELKKLQYILGGKGHILFDTADRILSAINLTDLWYQDENLALIYRLVGVAP